MAVKSSCHLKLSMPHQGLMGTVISAVAQPLSSVNYYRSKLRTSLYLKFDVFACRMCDTSINGVKS